MDEGYIITCDKCSRDWDGNAQCPCGIGDWDDDDLFNDENVLSFDEEFLGGSDFHTPSVRCISPTPPYIQKREFNSKYNAFTKLKQNVTYQKLYKKRYDILSDGWYSKKELKDYHGTNYIWNQQSPEVLFIKNDLLYLMGHCENISNDKIKLLIDTLFQKIY